MAEIKITDRDRLIELIEKWADNPQDVRLADYLLANGVFILPEDLRDTEDFSISTFIEAMQIYKEKDRYIKPPCDIGQTSNTLDLINRLQAENERLKGHQKDGFFNLLGNCLVFSKTLKDYNDMRKGLKAEAYKEFAERLKKAKQYSIERHENIVPVAVIDWILKELVGDDNG